MALRTCGTAPPHPPQSVADVENRNQFKNQHDNCLTQEVQIVTDFLPLQLQASLFVAT